MPNQPTLALSIRQPFAELILRGLKTYERRSRPTNIRDRVFIYSPKKPARVSSASIQAPVEIAESNLPLGLLVGTIEVFDCINVDDKNWHWLLRLPQRIDSVIIPRNRPQPIWFKPF